MVGNTQELLEALEELDRRRNYGGHLSRYFPEEGPYAAKKYAKHLEFFSLGRSKRERIFMAANRVGKTVAGAFEAACHLTGLYPPWWEGRVFEGPTDGWAAGDTAQTTRDILQRELLGDPIGSGMIAKDLIVSVTSKPGVPGAAERVVIKHASGKNSVIGFKTYDQGRRSYQGTAKDFVWFDEECPEDVYNEALVRTMTTNGVIYVTFTPLQGLTLFVQEFMKAAGDGEESQLSAKQKAIVMAGWDDVPHLGEKEKQEILDATPGYLKDSRSKGVPGLGAGAIYPYPENEIIVSPMPMPPEWRRFYGVDVGWNWTAAVFCAHDRDRDIVYVYDAYKSGGREPDLHAAAIKRRYAGLSSLVGAIDPASRQRGQADGRQLLKLYRDCGLKLIPADNAVQAGLDEVANRLATGRLKFFRGLTPLMDEYRLYRRDEKGRVVKESDHLMDALRYAIVSGIRYGRPAYKPTISGGGGKRYF